MNVTCTACQSSFDTDVSAEASSVQCPSCFTQIAIAAPAAAAKKSWVLRRTDGTLTTFDGAATLQKWIGEGSVTPDDELSRDGSGTWQTLGSIEKVARMFTRRQE